MVRGLARGADALAEVACLRMGPRGLPAFLSQRKETPRSYKIRGSDTGVSAGGPHISRSQWTQRAPSLCFVTAFPLFHLPLERPFVQCFDLFPAL